MNEKLIIPPHQINKVFMKCAEVSSINSGKTVRVADLMRECRKRAIVVPRQWAMYFLKRYTNLSLFQIGDMLGGKDHASVIHSLKIVDQLCESDKKYKSQIEEINKYVIDLCSAKKKTNFYNYTPVSNFKTLAEERLTKINRLEQELYECSLRIRDLELNLRAAAGEVRLYKHKLEYASMPGKILQGE